MNPLKSQMLEQIWRYGPKVSSATADRITDAIKPVVYAERDRADAAEWERDQLRAERDQALTLLRQIRRLSEPQPNDSMNAHFSPIAKMIDASHIFDDEGQQP